MRKQRSQRSGLKFQERRIIACTTMKLPYQGLSQNLKSSLDAAYSISGVGQHRALNDLKKETSL